MKTNDYPQTESNVNRLQNKVYELFVEKPVNYQILESKDEFQAASTDPRFWRIVDMDGYALHMLRVPLHVKNNELNDIERSFGVRLANRNELASAFKSSPTHQYKYPWGDQVSARNAPFLLRANPNGMGMNIAGLYFNGPDNPQDSKKNGLWMVTAERNSSGNYVQGDRSGTAGNVGVFGASAGSLPSQSESKALPEYRGILPEYRGILPEQRGIIPEARGTLPTSQEGNFLTPAGIGEGLELYPNEGYLVVKELQANERQIYQITKEILNNRISADYGIAGLSIGDAAKALLMEPGVETPVIILGVFGHCLNCPNPRTLTLPINGPNIAKATKIPVVEYPEFESHQVVGRQPILPLLTGNAQHNLDKRRIYYPTAETASTT